jgi:Domain of unknown function (DUF4383)
MRTATFAFFIGIVYLSIGLLGLIPDALLPPAADAPPVRLRVLHGDLLGLFPVNVLHSVGHVAVGAWGIVAWHGMANSRVFARALAIIWGALAVLGLIPATDTLFGALPIYGNDVWLHAATGALAVYFGWRHETDVERRSGPRSERREHEVPVEQDRRLGREDRRVPFSEEV